MKAIITRRGGEAIRFIIRPGQRFTLGRGKTCNITVNDKRISRKHVLLELDAKGLFITDLDSSNGTKVNDVPFTSGEKRCVCPYDILQIGGSEFEIELADLEKGERESLERTRVMYKPLVNSGEFRIVGQLGKGAGGTVYAAYQKALRRNVALKLPREDTEDDKDVCARLYREGVLYCRIKSPYVVSLYDLRAVGKDRGYLVMELVNGVSVRDKMHNGPLTLEEVLRIGEDIAQALSACHVAKVIHRDVKPGNILISPCGTAKLSDFGIAMSLTERDELPVLTPPDTGLGTLCYVPPEQAIDARSADPRSDIFGLGSTIYHALAGVPARDPHDAEELFTAFDEPVTPLHEIRPCPIELSALVDRMISPDPDKRPQGAMEIACALAKIRTRYCVQEQEEPVDTDSGVDDRPLVIQHSLSSTEH
jgi:serine/threonine protein kinase